MMWGKGYSIDTFQCFKADFITSKLTLQLVKAPPIEAANGSEKYQICPLVVVTLGEIESCQTCPNLIFTKRNPFVIPGSFTGEYIYIYSLRIYCFTHMRCQAPSSFLQEQQ